MATFFMFGNYTSEAIKEISINRTEKAIDTIRQLGGEVNGVYALLGEYDLLFCVKMPDVEAAMKASISLSQLTGISFHTCPGVKVEVFDRLATE
ncbi:MAG: hypothetical protein DRH90_01750 [Deltaproteobacteria bacterium]|nr:MAG: hypothetical protein DRH90_01750 [Deltaproteobacteria bacterium]RLC11553.1 MAG: hypothetical protein DRI24_18625 [Deltaproteobacteria bacterium]